MKFRSCDKMLTVTWLLLHKATAPAARTARRGPSYLQPSVLAAGSIRHHHQRLRRYAAFGAQPDLVQARWQPS